MHKSLDDGKLSLRVSQMTVSEQQIGGSIFESLYVVKSSFTESLFTNPWIQDSRVLRLPPAEDDIKD